MPNITDASIHHQSTELMQPNNEWTYGPDLPTLRIYHCITPMTQDPDETRFVLIGGGEIPGNDYDATTFLFDWSWNNNSWVQLDYLSVPTAQRHSCGATTLTDGQNIVLTTVGFEGNLVYFLNEGTTQWYTGPKLPNARQ